MRRSSNIFQHADQTFNNLSTTLFGVYLPPLKVYVCSRNILTFSNSRVEIKIKFYNLIFLIKMPLFKTDIIYSLLFLWLLISLIMNNYVPLKCVFWSFKVLICNTVRLKKKPKKEEAYEKILLRNRTTFKIIPRLINSSL